MNSYARTSPSFVICTAPHGAGGRWRDPHLVSAPSSFTADASSGPSTTTTALHNGAGASSLPPSPSLMLGVDGTLVVSEWPVVSATAGSVDVFPLSRAGLKPRSVDSDQDGEGEEHSSLQPPAVGARRLTGVAKRKKREEVRALLRDLHLSCVCACTGL
ncbi:hypothetical protein VYU27_005451 [Nannochloropsis oceanica]